MMINRKTRRAIAAVVAGSGLVIPSQAKLWMPAKPAIVRAESLRDIEKAKTKALLPGFCLPMVVAAATGGGITFVASAVGSSTSSADTTITLPAMQQDDLVLVGAVTDSSSNGGVPTTAGYTEVADVNISGGGNNERLIAHRKFTGASPNSQVVIDAPATGSRALTCIAMVFRGVNLTTPIDVTPTQNTGSTDCPSITPVTNNCMIVIFSGEYDTGGATDQTPGTVTSYSTPVTRYHDTGGTDAIIASAYRLLSGGAGVGENPAAFSAWAPGGADGSMTIALRPAA